ncbi:hypothetical protein [Brevibacillus brevis]|uniref:Uncharacterized protein n=1 Tax=Brevibacillus brevis TaxID=1393 RepID=A0ABY9T301_BREBE|nr:hypothetical protein [Brevibacillus brevis]WNC14269.1 hypothetical protein RGB73_26910 [Brevibacillus brevis]
MQSGMEPEISVVVDLVEEAYPGLATLANMQEWLEHRFEAPVAIVTTQGAGEVQSSLTSYQVEADAVIVLQFPLSEGIYQPLSAEPLRQLLRQKQYSYRGKTADICIEVDSATFRIWRDKKDRLEMTFRFTYHVPVPRESGEKLNAFDIQEAP